MQGSGKSGSGRILKMLIRYTPNYEDDDVGDDDDYDDDGPS